MKQVININFQGSVVPIEQTAYEILKMYIESLKVYFNNEPGRDEIINDIENRISELFQQRLKQGTTCITEEDIAAIKASIGTPEDFAETDGETVNTGTTGTTTPPPHATYVRPSKLYRDENNKVLGGVCSGIAHYFNLDVSLVRIIFVILLFTGGLSLIPYIILWIVIPSSASLEIGAQRKRLFRDPENRLIGGVASGIANYFNINPWIPRLIFLLPLFSYLGKWGWDWDWQGGFFIFRSTSLIIYIILWLVLPEANTTAEKLEMKGEKVDLNSIKDSVVKEMKDLESRASQLGKQDRNFLETGLGPVPASALYKRGRGGSIGYVISTLFKIFAYFIIGIIVFALLAGLFGLTVASIGLFPLKEYILMGQTQNLLAWGTLIFFIILPLVGLITWIIRRLGKLRGHSAAFSTTFILLWVVGWVCFISLISAVGKDFRRESNYNAEAVQLSNPGVSKLEITSRKNVDYFNRRKMLRFNPFVNITEDTAYIPNIKINIIKATGDSFRVETVKFANGSSKQLADRNASKIQYTINQQDTVLYVDNGISINTTDKFRNQQVIINVYVPVGKRIIIDGKLKVGSLVRIHSGGIGFEEDYDGFTHEDAEGGWEQGIEYQMRPDGLYTLDGRNARDSYNDAKGWDDNNSDEWKEEDFIDSNSKEELKKIDSLKEQIKIRERKNRDSLEKMKDEIEQELRKIADKTTIQRESFNTTLTIFNPIY